MDGREPGAGTVGSTPESSDRGAVTGPRHATEIRLLERIVWSLPSYHYSAAEIYDREKERLFYTKWLCAAREEELAEPGDFITRQVADESVILLRDRSATIRAFYNVCRHRGTRLCTEAEGRFPRHGITCPYHGWTYGFDGRLQGTPNMVKMPDFEKADYPLHPVHVTLWEGFVFISLAPQPVPLAEQMEGLFTHFARYDLRTLRRATRFVYDVAANWKLVVENFTECFHCPHIHPELNRITPYLGGGAAREEGARAWRGGHWMELAEGRYTLTVTGEKRRPNLGGIYPEDWNRVYYNTLYPNLFLSLHPDYALTHTLWPDGPGRTRVVCEWLFEPATMAAGDFDSSDTVEFWDLVNKQDFHVCELAQQGNRSRAHRHGIHVAQESGPQHFTRYIRAELGD